MYLFFILNDNQLTESVNKYIWELYNSMNYTRAYYLFINFLKERHCHNCNKLTMNESIHLTYRLYE